MPHPIYSIIDQSIKSGHSAATASFVSAIIRGRNLGRQYDKRAVVDMIQSHKLVRLEASGLEPCVTLPGQAVIEARIARWLARAMGASRWGLPPANASLSGSQALGWALVSGSPVACLTGGPGTGKTYVTARIIEAMVKKANLVYACAPTGKAASVLHEKLSGLVEVTTLHRMIGWHPGSNPIIDRFNPIDADVIIIDEASMLSSQMMANLLDAIEPERTKVLFVGDPDQLSPIGWGSPFKSICANEMIPVAHLTEIHRQKDGNGIPKLAESIANGRFDIPDTDVSYYAMGHKETAGWVVRQYVQSIGERGTSPADRLILSPVKQMKFDASTANMNEAISNGLHMKRTIKNSKFTIGDRIMFTVNDYGHGFVNGELGTLLAFDKGRAKIINDSGRVYNLEGWSLSKYAEWAYAMTIHKAQGSEADTVILVTVNGAPHMYTRELIYTAVTRAKSRLVIVGDMQILKAAVKRRSRRVSILDYLHKGSNSQIDRLLDLHAPDPNSLKKKFVSIRNDEKKKHRTFDEMFGHLI